MSLINEEDNLDDLFNKHSYNKKSLNITKPIHVIEPINKDSYDKLIKYERNRLIGMQQELEDYESKYRGTSLVEEYQRKKGTNNKSRGFDKDKDMNIGSIDSKRAIAIMRDNKGLQGRFEAKEKYIGY